MVSTFPFKNKIANFYHVVNELAIIAFYVSLLICTNLKNHSIDESTAEACKYLIIFAWGLNIVIAACLAIIKGYQKIKNWILSRNSKVSPIVEENATRALKTVNSPRFPKDKPSDFERYNKFFT